MPLIEAACGVIFYLSKVEMAFRDEGDLFDLYKIEFEDLDIVVDAMLDEGGRSAKLAALSIFARYYRTEHKTLIGGLEFDKRECPDIRRRNRPIQLKDRDVMVTHSLIVPYLEEHAAKHPEDTHDAIYTLYYLLDMMPTEKMLERFSLDEIQRVIEPLMEDEKIGKVVDKILKLPERGNHAGTKNAVLAIHNKCQAIKMHELQQEMEAKGIFVERRVDSSPERRRRFTDRPHNVNRTQNRERDFQPGYDNKYSRPPQQFHEQRRRDHREMTREDYFPRSHEIDRGRDPYRKNDGYSYRPERVLASVVDLKADEDSNPESERMTDAPKKTVVNRAQELQESDYPMEPPVPFGNMLPAILNRMDRALIPAESLRDVKERDLGQHIVAMLNSRLKGAKVVAGITETGQVRGVVMDRKMRDRFRVEFDHKFLDPNRVISPMVTTDMVKLTFRPVSSNRPSDRDIERVLIIVEITNVPKGKVFKAEGEAFIRSKKTKTTERMDMTDIQRLVADEAKEN